MVAARDSTSLPQRFARALKDNATLALLIGVIVLGICPRLSHINRSYFLDFHAWRQADSAAFVHGYLVDSINPFDPSIDRQPCTAKDHAFGRVEAELPVVPFLAALPLRIFGQTDTSAAYLRSVSILVFVLGCLALFGCMRELGADDADALLAVAAFGAAPLAIFFTRSPQPDGQSLSVAFAAVWALLRYLKRRRLSDALALFVFTCLLLLMKISNAYVGIVMGYLVVVERKPRALLGDVPLLAAALAACALAAAWYWHAHSFGWSFGVWSEAPHDRKFAELHQFADPLVWQKLLARLNWDILTVAGCILAAIGLCARSSVAYVRVAAVWMLSATLFVVLSLNAQLRHVYYQLCWVPPAALAQAAGMRLLWKQGAYGRMGLALLVIVHCAITRSVLWGEAPNASVEGVSYFTQDISLREPIEAVRRLVPEHMLMVTTERDPRLYWNSRHRGYFCDSSKLSDIRHCMAGTSEYLLVGARMRAHLSAKTSFQEGFEELWNGQFYALYKQRP